MEPVDTLRVMTWNLDSVVYAPGWAHAGKARRCVSLVQRHGVSILVLQEVAEDGQLPALRAAFTAALPRWRVVAAATGPAFCPKDSYGKPVQETHAFCFDADRVALLEPPVAFLQDRGGDAAFKRPPVLAEFKEASSGLFLALCSVHLRADDGARRAVDEALAFGRRVLPALEAELGDRVRSLVVLGDFNLAPHASVGGLLLHPAGGKSFDQLRACRARFAHVNEAPTNCAAIAGEACVYDNVWLSAEMGARLVASESGAKSTVLSLDEDALADWLRENGHAQDGAACAVVTRAQKDGFAAWLWAERCRAERASRSNGASTSPSNAEIQPQPLRKQPTKWFSHGCSASDHRPLFFELRLASASHAAGPPGSAAAAAAAAASRRLSVLPAPRADADECDALDGHARDLAALRDSLAAITLGGGASSAAAAAPPSPDVLRAIASSLVGHAAALADASKRLARASTAADVAAADGGDPPAGGHRCAGTCANKERCKNQGRSLVEVPLGSGAFWCAKHKAAGAAVASGATKD